MGVSDTGQSGKCIVVSRCSACFVWVSARRITLRKQEYQYLVNDHLSALCSLLFHSCYVCALSLIHISYSHMHIFIKITHNL